MSFVEERKALTREKRISTISHYDGNLDGLKDESQGAEIKQRIRTLAQVSQDEILYAISVLSKIDQAAVIVHGAAGCSASGIFFNENKNFEFYTTNLQERDTILGGDGKLRKAILRAHEEVHPKVIFVVGTPVVAINNDEVNALILELEEELEIRIIYIYTDGFKTKAPVTGFDIVSHSLLRYVVDRQKGEISEKEDFVNVVSFSENNENLAAVVEILKDLGVSYHLLPQYASVDVIAEAGRAKATITLNEEEGSYFARELEEVFHVPYIRTKSPVGLRATRHFITRLAKQLGIEEQAAAYIQKKEAEIQPYLQTPVLAGKNVFLDESLEVVLGFAEIVGALGGTVEGIAIPYIDLENRAYLEKLSELKGAAAVIIANDQPFEKSNILVKKQIDYYIGGKSDVAFATEQGSIPLSGQHLAYFGYEGIRQLINQIKRASIYRERSKKRLYKESWLKKSSNWYVKQEVK